MITVVEKLQANQTNNLRALVPLGNPTMSQTAVKRQVLTGVVDTLFRPTPSHLISKKKILGPIESIPLGQTSDKIALDNTYETSHMSSNPTPVMDAPTKLLPGSPELVDIPGGKQPSDNWYHRASRSYMFGPAAIALVFFLVSLVVVSCALADYASRLERCRQLNITADNCDVEPILLSNVTVMDVIN